MSVVFLDTETTGLDSDRHDVWDIGVIHGGGEVQWYVEPDLSTADPTALRMNRYYERTSAIAHDWSSPPYVARELARILAGNHVVGAVPDFDARFLDRWLRKHGQAPAHHYHLIDVETLAVGWLRHVHAVTSDHSVRTTIKEVLDLPWRSDDLSRACGVEPPGELERHTALGDARWVKRWYRVLMGGGS